ncbi:unnamed protein product [Caenorhabditis bovis]|uniref:Uncharacterized protein n=1 Tax=Caenorhabditis bovis TaxID=2654633 RepID=A0A8S1E8R7_9PELO|nr:unnamed protein product [Caenorhabditis bovis]
MNSQLVSRLALLILFRFLHLLVLFESDVFALITRYFDSRKDEDVEVFNILARYRFDETDATRESDFIIFHERTTTFDEICEEGWHIYSINERYVYFVQIESVDFETNVSVEKCSKLSRKLFEYADKIARIDVEKFEKFAKKCPPFMCHVVMLHSAPCGGGTVAAKLLQACDASKLSLLVIGEPPFLTSLSVLSTSLSIEVMRGLCKASLRYSLIHQKPNQTIVLKARPCCTKIVPYIHAECASIQHFFIGNRNYLDVISRLVTYTSTQIPVFSLVHIFQFIKSYINIVQLCWLLGHSKYLVDAISSWRLMEEELITKVGPKTDVEFAVGQVYGSLINYQRNVNYFALDTVFINDLITDTASQIRPILNLCAVSDLAIPECIEWKRSAEEVLKNVWDTVELPKEDVRRVHEIVELIEQN